MSWDTIVSTFAAAFAGSLAAVAVTMYIDSSSKKAQAKTKLLNAINSQCDRLLGYAVSHGNAVVIASQNYRSGRVPGAPSKPPIKLLQTEILGVGSVFRGDTRFAIEEIVQLVREAEVEYPPKPDEIADWETELANLQMLAIAIAKWDGKKSRLPTLADLGKAPVMS